MRVAIHPSSAWVGRHLTHHEGRRFDLDHRSTAAGRRGGAGEAGRAGSPDDRSAQRMPFSIKGTSAPIDCGVTTPAPVFTETPVNPYLDDSTHCVTGRKPWR